MLYYFKDDKGDLSCAEGDMDVNDQDECRILVTQATGLYVAGAVLELTVVNPDEKQEPAVA